MDNTHKLLLAMCEALDLEVEEKYFHPFTLNEITKEGCNALLNEIPECNLPPIIDYKVTKKPIEMSTLELGGGIATKMKEDNKGACTNCLGEGVTGRGYHGITGMMDVERPTCSSCDGSGLSTHTTPKMTSE